MPTFVSHPALFVWLGTVLQILSGCSEERTFPSTATDKPLATSSKSKMISPMSMFGKTDLKQWSQFRGPTGMGLSDATNLPLEWSTEKNIVWKTELPGAGASSPIVFGDRIYVTCYTGFFVPGQDSEGTTADLKRHLLAIDRSDGKIIWDQSVPAKLPEENSIRDHGFAASTPAADEDGVYVFFGKSGVFAFDHEGNQKWQTSVGETTHGWGSSASPIIHNDLLLINASVESESLIALNRKTGEQVWQAQQIKESWSTPLVITANSGRQEIIVPTQGAVYAFDPASGDQLWNCHTDIAWYMVPTVVAHEGIIYCLGGRSGIASLAIRAGGDGDVTPTHRLWTTTNGSNVSSPVFHDGHLYWMNDSQNIAYCADAASGELVYEKRVKRAGQIYGSPVLADGRIYYQDRAGRTFVLPAEPRFELLATNQLDDGGVFNCGLVVDGERLLIRSDRFLYSIGIDEK